ncbi:MAG: phosphoheptose isomerase [Chlamydiae bacterium CG10_big_fil_rev_8_21_14_0_10_35_9]|nr:MAG: phosphoheptose isomerase [Chlamydiae bacterium CG10_big_fil_rev_8_21_14_0_10_35_9]
MKEQILEEVDSAIKAVEKLREEKALSFIETAAELIAQCFLQKGKIIIAGNGGSLCDAMHFAEELTGQFRKKRMALPAIALTDPGLISCTANDFGYNQVFKRGVEAYGSTGDIFIALTTSGNSENLIEAVKMSKELKLTTIAFLGKTGGQMRGMCDLEWIVEGFATSDRIQEAHMTAIHILIEMVERKLFGLEKLEKLKSIHESSRTV